MTTNTFHTKVIKTSKHNQARVTKTTTPHGEFLTPTFMPVGTRAAVNCMNPEELTSSGAQIILGGNTYHMLVSPDMQIIQSLGGMHQMMNWHKPMLTDSGGYQVFSLSKNKNLCKIKEDGAHFKHPYNGKIIHLTPKTSIEAQKIIGADMIMAFDECTPENGGRDAAIAAMERTHRWLMISKETHEQQPNSVYGYRQALLGIIQGGSFRDLREESTRTILKADLDGIAIGGEVIGFDMPKTCEIINWVKPMLPEGKVRYTMGVGLNPQDLLDVVACGIDIFDCVAPTRNARHGALYHCTPIKTEKWVKLEGAPNHRILIKKSMYADDNRPILDGCDCYTCQHYSRGYLHFLFKQAQALYTSLACIHNIRVMLKICEVMREKIMEDS